MRVVLDTNVFLSALLSPHSFSDTIYRAWLKEKFHLITSTIQLDELRRASRYPKFKSILQPAQVGTMINNLRNATILQNLTTYHPIEIDDPNDTFLLSMVIVGNADYLVTGDRRAGLLQKNKIKQTRIVMPTTFCTDILG